MADKIIIFDTTLRDGEQASGFHMLKHEKLQIAKQLAKLGVDVIEAGFAASSPGDFESIYEIAKQVGSKQGPIICSLSRAIDEDIELAAKAIEPAYRKRIHTFIATSDIHIDEKLKKDRFWIIERVQQAVKKAKSYVSDVEFSCEDFGRTDLDYIIEVAEAAIKAGATTINLPDTVGWLTPSESYEKVKYVIETLRKKGFNPVFSVHNHNDFGMATATTIEAIKAGARQVEVTINGIGERAGNTSLEEVVAILKTRKIGETNINTQLIGEISSLVSKITNNYPQANKAIVGKNAFSHEAGIHQDGILKQRRTYETMDPEDFGVQSLLTFGPRSGRNALKSKYSQLGISLEEQEFQEVAKRFIRLADEKKEIDDADLILSIKNETEIPRYYSLVSYHPVHTNSVFGTVVELSIEGKNQRIYAEGNGQIDASINAIKKAISRYDIKLNDFKVNSQGRGSDALGHSKAFVSKNNWEVKGNSTESDVVKSAIEAFLDGVNRIKYIEDYFNKTKF